MARERGQGGELLLGGDPRQEASSARERVKGGWQHRGAVVAPRCYVNRPKPAGRKRFNSSQDESIRIEIAIYR